LNIISIPPISMATLMFYVGFYHFLIYRRKKENRENFTFALSCFSVGLYALCCSGLYNVSSPEIGVEWQRFQVITLAVLATTLLWFISDYTGCTNKKIVMGFTLYYLFAAISGLLIRSDLTWTSVASIKEIRLPFGYDIIYNEMVPGILTNFQSIVGVIYSLYIIKVSLKFYRYGNKRKGLPLLLAISLLFAGSLNDTFVSSGFYDFIYILEYSYIGMILVFTFFLTSKVIKAGEIKAALIESEEKFRTLFESSMDAILIYDPKNGFIDCNPATLKLFGIGQKEKFFNFEPSDLSPNYQPDGISSDEKASMMINQAFKKGSNLFEWKHKRITGEEFDASVLLTRIEIFDHPTLLGTIRDISNIKQAQEMMVQSEKMMSVGGLAAGMAHEINNPLAGMMQNADVMVRRLTDTKLKKNITTAEEMDLKMEAIRSFMEKRDIIKMATAIKTAGIRMAKIVENMLSFARKSDAEVSSHLITELLDKTLQIAATDFDLKKHYDFKNIKIKKDYNTVPMVLCEASKIQQEQTFIDREQLNNGCPGVDQILKRVAHLIESCEYLLQNTKSYGACGNCWNQDQIDENIVGLQVETAGHIKVHVVKIEAEIVAPHIAKKLL
jgi:PAS domain S-box-containing protein